ncbi:DUF302 domain-containing protein [Paraburkholderia humisilvae]|uniref:DUF302 domain-containing protein n=1 Tax=Paraburkholderia humisilvae TaxID=627669 RepID=A0A6J5EY98_9BURK|nr:DUF302 domain-containing protein [Paraburkholderia humisilvae]CAB3771550.1 hypothetical protein LMG29542_06643 [Paraburkholderia humisilvae]
MNLGFFSLPLEPLILFASVVAARLVFIGRYLPAYEGNAMKRLDVAHHPSRVAAASLLVFFTFWMEPVMTARAETPDAVPASLVTVQSQYDFATTITRLRDTLAARGLTLFADIDQSEAAAGVGLPLRPPRLFLFGNPKSGTPVMAAYPHAALELPLRAVVWEDADRRVYIDYQDVTKTLTSYGVVASQLVALQPVPALLRAVAGQ